MKKKKMVDVGCSNLFKPRLAALSAQLAKIIGAAGEDLSAAGQHQGVTPAWADAGHLSNIGNNLHEQNIKINLVESDVI
jgi:hypothetical protein